MVREKIQKKKYRKRKNESEKIHTKKKQRIVIFEGGPT